MDEKMGRDHQIKNRLTLAYLELKNIGKKFGNRPVLSDISLELKQGSFLSLLGPSGCGKTTLLRIIAGLESADQGSILLNGKEISSIPVQSRNIGIVFQNYALFPHMNVFENVAYGLKIKKLKSTEINTKVNAVLEKVNLLQKSSQQVGQLSGGEQQRVALARVMVTEPEIILLDEPLSNLDYTLRLEARNELKRLQHEIGITAVFVTHDQTEALALSDQVAIMQEGKIIQSDRPETIYHHPATRYVASFVGHYNFFTPDQSSQLLKHPIEDGKIAAVLPEHTSFDLSNTETGLFITDILFGGTLTEYTLQSGTLKMKSILMSHTNQSFNIGDQVKLSVLPHQIKMLA